MAQQEDLPDSFVGPSPLCSKRPSAPQHQVLLNRCRICYKTSLNSWFISINILLLLCYEWSVSLHLPHLCVSWRTYLPLQGTDGLAAPYWVFLSLQVISFSYELCRGDVETFLLGQKESHSFWCCCWYLKAVGCTAVWRQWFDVLSTGKLCWFSLVKDKTTSLMHSGPCFLLYFPNLPVVRSEEEGGEGEPERAGTNNISKLWQTLVA